MLLGALSVAFFLLFLQGVAALARMFFPGAVCNPAGPFGIALSFPILLIVFLLAAGFFLFQWWKEWDRSLEILWLLLLSAGTSNALERIVHGCVFDFLSLPGIPLFNLADVALSLSVVFLLVREFLKRG